MPDPQVDEKTQQKAYVYKSLTVKETLQIVKWCWDILYKVSPKYTLLNLISNLIGNTKEILNAFVFAKGLDKALSIASSESPRISDIFPSIGIMIGVVVAGELIDTFNRQVDQEFNMIVPTEMDILVQKKIKSLGIQTLDSPGFNNLLNRATGSMDSVYRIFSLFVRTISAIVSFTIAGFLLLQNIPFALPLYLILALPIFLVDQHFTKRTFKLEFEETENRRVTGATSHQLLKYDFLSEILVNNSFDWLVKKCYDYKLFYRGKLLKILEKWRLFLLAVGMISEFARIFTFVWLLIRIITRKITAGAFYFQISLINRMDANVYNLVSNINRISEISLRTRDSFELFNLDPVFPDGTEIIPKFKLGPMVEFKNVSFKYPSSDKYLFVDLNLKINPQEKIAIVGHNGAGKTSLIKLIAKMYKADKGEVLVNNMNINTLQGESYFRNLGILWQNFNTHHQISVEENIQIGDAERPLDKERVIEAATKSDALGFINEFPLKFDQILSSSFKNGITPSTGQWQKIAIARFFYRDAPLIIFDEPTATIDAVAEKKIFDNIYAHLEGKTVIIISHKFSTVRNADRIIVLDHGRIVEEGPHEKLMALNGYYAKAFGLQAEGYRER